MVVMPINKYAIIATHGVGKTSIVSYMDFYFRQMSQIPEVIPESAREGVRRGFPINEKTTLDSQIELQNIQKRNETQSQERYLLGEIQHIICDRSVLDNYIYALYRFGEKAKFQMYDSVMQWMQKNPYTHLLKIPLWNTDANLTDDGVRSLDKRFQKDIDFLLDDTLEESGLEYKVIPKGIFNIDPFTDPDFQMAKLREYFDEEFNIVRKPLANKTKYSDF